MADSFFMRLDITGRHVEITPPVRQLITKRLSRLERLLNDAAVSAIITLTKEKYRLRTEIAVHTKGDHVLRGNGEGNAWPVSVRQATQKIEQQAQTLKGKWDGRKRKGASARDVAEPAAGEAAPAARVWGAPRGGEGARRARGTSRCRSTTPRCASKPEPRASSSSATRTPR